jgi:alkanesulfonate monooxygenase
MDSLLTAFGFHRPDPIVLATALATLTERITFMVAVRSGVCSPTSLVQQVNTVSALTGGRICVNIVAGHTPAEQRAYGDFLSHDERYERTDEFLTICHSLWSGKGQGTNDVQRQVLRHRQRDAQHTVCVERARTTRDLPGW